MWLSHKQMAIIDIPLRRNEPQKKNACAKDAIPVTAMRQLAPRSLLVDLEPLPN